MKTNRIKLSNRMKELCNLVPENSETLADVGCDHGKVIAYLLQNNKINFGYATDISAPSLKKCEQLLNSLNITNYKSVCCNGLEGLQNVGNIDSVIISGMGGQEIIKILLNNSINVKTYILQPQKNAFVLRKFLNKIGYKIIYDNLISEKDKFYVIIKAEKGKQKHSKKELYFGKMLIKQKNESFYNYLKQEKLVLDVLKEINKITKEQKIYLKYINKQLKKY